MERQRTAFFCRELFHVIFSDVHKVILALRLALWDLLFIDYFNVYFLFSSSSLPSTDVSARFHI